MRGRRIGEAARQAGGGGWALASGRMDAPVLLGVLYVVLGVAFLASYGRVRARSRVLSLAWLFIGVLLTANGVLRIVQALDGG